MLRCFDRIKGTFVKPFPIGKEVKIFVCGPTLYDDLHLGHLRVLFTTDLISRYFIINSYKARVLINLTDLDLKIIERSKKEGKNSEEIVQEYLNNVTEDIKELRLAGEINFARPSLLVNDSLEIIKELKAKNLSYETESGIFCDLSFSNNLGRLANIDKSIVLNILFEPDEKKKNPADFRLLMKFDGNEMIGWHLQDYTAIYKYFDGTCDFHIGARELIFPHHEFTMVIGEYHRKLYPISKHFVHVGLLKYKGEKMSKSLGNAIYYREIKKEYDLDSLRIYFYMMKFNRDYNFDLYKLKIANKIKNKLKNIKMKKGRRKYMNKKRIIEFRNRFLKEIENNLNSKGAILAWLELIEFSEKASLNDELKEEMKKSYVLFSRMTGILEDFRIE